MRSYRSAYRAVALLAGLATTAAAQAGPSVYVPDATAFASAGFGGGANSLVHATSGLYTAQTGTLAYAGNAASAYASLSRGIVRGYASAGSIRHNSGADVASSFADTLHFSNKTGGIATLSLTYAIDGDFSRNINDFPPSAFNTASLSLNGCGSCGNSLYQHIQVGTLGQVVGDVARMRVDFDGNVGFDDYGHLVDPARFLTGSTFAGGHMTGFISTTLFIPTGETTLGVRADLVLFCRDGAVCDFGHTGQFSFGGLANGLRFTSDSGTFLSARPVTGGAAPEPASWALMIVGFGLAGARLRRRGREAAAVA